MLDINTENALSWIWHRNRNQLDKVTLPEIKRAYFDAIGSFKIDCLIGIDWEAIKRELLVRLHPPTQLPQNAYQAISAEQAIKAVQQYTIESGVTNISYEYIITREEG